MRNLKKVSEYAIASGFTEAQLRWWLFNAEANGLKAAGAIVRIGRRVFIDIDGFDRWITSQNEQVAA